MTPQLLISFQFLYCQPTTFWAMPIPRENTRDWVKIESVLKKGPTLGSKIWPLFWSLVYPKCSKLEVYNPQVMILIFFAIIYKSNDPQIFHLQKKLWLYKLFMRLGACFGTIWKVHPVLFVAVVLRVERPLTLFGERCSLLRTHALPRSLTTSPWWGKCFSKQIGYFKKYAEKYYNICFSSSYCICL